MECAAGSVGLCPRRIGIAFVLGAGKTGSWRKVDAKTAATLVNRLPAEGRRLETTAGVLRSLRRIQSLIHVIILYTCTPACV